MKADTNNETRPKYIGIPLAEYIFFISVPYISTIEGGTPASAPIEPPITVMDCIRVFFASGMSDVKIPPITAKNKSGTR